MRIYDVRTSGILRRLVPLPLQQIKALFVVLSKVLALQRLVLLPVRKSSLTMEIIVQHPRRMPPHAMPIAASKMPPNANS
jgi:hypothetical protein